MSSDWLTVALHRAHLTLDEFVTRFAAAIVTTHPTSKYASPDAVRDLVGAWQHGLTVSYRHHDTVARIVGMTPAALAAAYQADATVPDRGLVEPRGARAARRKAMTAAPSRPVNRARQAARRADLDAARRRRRATFSAWLIHTTTAKGFDVSIWPVSWVSGSLPRLFDLEQIATTLDVPLAVVLYQAGRPPLEQLRVRHGADPTGSLPALLHSWQTAAGLDNAQAAEQAMMSPCEWSRYRAGSKIPSVTKVVQIAYGTGLDPVTIAQACTAAADVPSAFVDDVRAGGTGVGAMARLWIVRHHTTIDGLAAAAGCSTPAAGTLLDGTATPVTLAAFARLLDVPAGDVFTVAGFDGHFADRLGRAFDAAARRRGPAVPFAKLVRQARLKAGWTLEQAAAELGDAHQAHLCRIESGRMNASYETVVRYCDTFHIPLRDGLRAGGFVPVVTTVAA